MIVLFFDPPEEEAVARLKKLRKVEASMLPAMKRQGLIDDYALNDEDGDALRVVVGKKTSTSLQDVKRSVDAFESPAVDEVEELEFLRRRVPRLEKDLTAATRKFLHTETRLKTAERNVAESEAARTEELESRVTERERSAAQVKELQDENSDLRDEVHAAERAGVAEVERVRKDARATLKAMQRHAREVAEQETEVTRREVIVESKVTEKTLLINELERTKTWVDETLTWIEEMLSGTEIDDEELKSYVHDKRDEFHDESPWEQLIGRDLTRFANR